MKPSTAMQNIYFIFLMLKSPEMCQKISGKFTISRTRLQVLSEVYKGKGFK